MGSLVLFLISVDLNLSFSLFSLMLTIGLLYIAFPVFRYVPGIPDLPNSFNMNGCCILSIFLASKEMIICFFLIKSEKQTNMYSFPQRACSRYGAVHLENGGSSPSCPREPIWSSSPLKRLTISDSRDIEDVIKTPQRKCDLDLSEHASVITGFCRMKEGARNLSVRGERESGKDPSLPSTIISSE